MKVVSATLYTDSTDGPGDVLDKPLAWFQRIAGWKLAGRLTAFSTYLASEPLPDAACGIHVVLLAGEDHVDVMQLFREMEQHGEIRYGVVMLAQPDDEDFGVSTFIIGRARVAAQ